MAVVIPQWAGYMVAAFEAPAEWLPAIRDGAFEDGARMLIPTLVWTIYLAVSKRARNTYVE